MTAQPSVIGIIPAGGSDNAPARTEKQPLPSGGMDRTVIVWLRRDLRLEDNPALVAAARTASTVIPVYIWAPEEEGEFLPGRCSRWWLHMSLHSLAERFKGLGSRLVFLRSQDSFASLLSLAKATGAAAVFYNHLYDPISLVRDNSVKQGLIYHGYSVETFNSDLLFEPWEVYDKDAQPFTSVSGFWSAVCSMPCDPQLPLLPPESLPAVPAELPAVEGVPLVDLGIISPEEQIPNEVLSRRWTPGDVSAIHRLETFLREELRSFGLAKGEGVCAVGGIGGMGDTSMLSPHLHFGEVSVRRIWYQVRQLQWEWHQQGDKEQEDGGFLAQLGYREYSRYLSFHFPFALERPLSMQLQECPWQYDEGMFRAWRQGQTGYPLVDAGMRQLWATGWISNKLRVVCASFLVKNLLLPWQWGLKHFMSALIDADMECDMLGWQYVMGSVTDGHAWEQIYDQREQGRILDPKGHYVRRWIPQLSRFPTKFIHCPWEAPPDVVEVARVEFGEDYPARVITCEESLSLVWRAQATMRQKMSAATDPWVARAGLAAAVTMSLSHMGVVRPATGVRGGGGGHGMLADGAGAGEGKFSNLTPARMASDAASNMGVASEKGSIAPQGKGSHAPSEEASEGKGQVPAAGGRRVGGIMGGERPGRAPRGGGEGAGGGEEGACERPPPAETSGGERSPAPSSTGGEDAPHMPGSSQRGGSPAVDRTSPGRGEGGEGGEGPVVPMGFDEDLAAAAAAAAAAGSNGTGKFRRVGTRRSSRRRSTDDDGWALPTPGQSLRHLASVDKARRSSRPCAEPPTPPDEPPAWTFGEGAQLPRGLRDDDDTSHTNPSGGGLEGPGGGVEGPGGPSGLPFSSWTLGPGDEDVATAEGPDARGWGGVPFAGWQLEGVVEEEERRASMENRDSRRGSAEDEQRASLENRDARRGSAGSIESGSFDTHGGRRPRRGGSFERGEGIPAPVPAPSPAAAAALAAFAAGSRSPEEGGGGRGDSTEGSVCNSVSMALAEEEGPEGDSLSTPAASARAAAGITAACPPVVDRSSIDFAGENSVPAIAAGGGEA